MNGNNEPHEDCGYTRDGDNCMTQYANYTNSNTRIYKGANFDEGCPCPHVVFANPGCFDHYTCKRISEAGNCCTFDVIAEGDNRIGYQWK